MAPNYIICEMIHNVQLGVNVADMLSYYHDVLESSERRYKKKIVVEKADVCSSAMTKTFTKSLSRQPTIFTIKWA